VPSLPEHCPEVRNHPRALPTPIPFLCGEFALTGALSRWFAAPAQHPANSATPHARVLALGVSHRSLHWPRRTRFPSLRPGLLAEVAPTRVEHPSAIHSPPVTFSHLEPCHRVRPSVGPDRSAHPHPRPLTALAHLSVLACTRARTLALGSDLVC
jgi:hypothetical protein